MIGSVRLRNGEKPGQGLPNPTTFALSTVDGPDHFWNTVLNSDSRTDFINCGTTELMIDAAHPWEDWNHPEEG